MFAPMMASGGGSIKKHYDIVYLSSITKYGVSSDDVFTLANYNYSGQVYDDSCLTMMMEGTHKVTVTTKKACKAMYKDGTSATFAANTTIITGNQALFSQQCICLTYDE